MKPLSCAAVAEQIELYALHECDAATGEAVARHLAECVACARAYQQARHMLILLDLTERGPALLGRLETRIAAQARRPRPPHILRPPARRALALAALLLITLGLGWIVRPAAGPSPGPLLATLTIPERLQMAPAAMVGVRGKHEGLVAIDPRALRRAVQAGQPPPPPAPGLAVSLVNRGHQDAVLDLRPGKYDFRIDLAGPGVERVAAPVPAELPFASPGLLRLAPGGRQTLTVQHASEVEAGRVRYVYWTKPGRYTLSVRLRVPVLFTPRTVWTVVTPPISFDVQGPPE
jgi:hypothetical protein